MNLWLYYLIFGSGFGLADRESDTTWFVLGGRAYHWSGWFGCQLQSFEWRRPEVGETRVLAGVIFRPFNFERRWFLYRVTWSGDEFCGPVDYSNKAIRAFKKKLGEL